MHYRVHLGVRLLASAPPAYAISSAPKSDFGLAARVVKPARASPCWGSESQISNGFLAEIRPKINLTRIEADLGGMGFGHEKARQFTKKSHVEKPFGFEAGRVGLGFMSLATEGTRGAKVEA